MNISKLPKAFEILQSIEDIEADIHDLDEMANIVADKNIVISIVFDVRGQDVNHQEEKTVTHQMTGVVGPDGVIRLFAKNDNDMYGLPSEESTEGIYGWEVDAVDTLSMIGVLYRSRMNSKKKLENRLKRLGVEL